VKSGRRNPAAKPESGARKVTRAQPAASRKPAFLTSADEEQLEYAALTNAAVRKLLAYVRHLEEGTP
jgi:hypothetical protein